PSMALEGVSRPSAGARPLRRPTLQLDQPELLIALEETCALREERGHQRHLGRVLLPGAPIVHDRRAPVVQKHVVADEQGGGDIVAAPPPGGPPPRRAG